jgi:hypothetical protein
MKNPTLHLCMASLLSLILLACTAAFGQLTPSGDSYTNTAASTTNYGAKTLLDVESSQTTFIQFDLSSIPSGYTSTDITKATLKLYVNAVTTAGSFNVDYVNGTWTESTIDASNAPALGTTIAASIPLTSKDKNQYILADVTAAVQAWLSGTANDGVALVANSPLNASFDAKENTTTSHPAELDIVFAGGGGGITGITTGAGSGLIGGGTSGTLNLSLTNACAAKQVLQWSGSAWACASAGTGTITGVTAGTDLTGGGTSGNVTLSLNTAATNALYAQLGANNTFTGVQTISSGVNITSGSLSATLAVAGGNAIIGTETATTGTSIGVLGNSSSASGYGVEGTSPNVGVQGTGANVGVIGTTTSTSGAGVVANSFATTGTTYGIVGAANSTSGVGVYGIENATTGSAIGVLGTSSSSSGFGVAGNSPYVGVFGGQAGQEFSSSGQPYGVVGASPTVGVYGASSGASAVGGTGVLHNNGVWGDYAGSDGIGVLGTADNSWAGAFLNNSSTIPTIYAENVTTNAGGGVFVGQMPYLGANGQAIIGDPGCGAGSGRMAIQLSLNGMSNCNNYTLTGGSNGETYLNALAGETVHLRVNNTDALVASGSGISITGTLSATGTKNFRIDHPLDPANKYLTHAAIESSEVLNLYTGNAILDDSGEAVVQLPEWFESINKDFRYQLTPIGASGRDLYIAEEVSVGHFKIAGGKPGAKVSWQVSAVRNDAWEKAYPMLVESDKGADRGHYLTPELYGQPATTRIGYEAVPPENEQIVHHQRPSLHSGNASPAQSITLPVPPKPVLPKVAPLPHVASQAHQPEVNQK